MVKNYFFLSISLFFILTTINSSAQVPGKISSGFSFGGTGIAGVPIQLRPFKQLSLDIGVYARAAHVDVFEPKWYLGPSLDAGLNLYFSHRIKPDKNRSVSHGLYIKGGMGLKDLQEKTLSIGWVQEFYNEKHPGRFIQLQLGPSVRHLTETFINTRYPPGYQEQTQEWYSGMIYTRLCYFFSIL